MLQKIRKIPFLFGLKTVILAVLVCISIVMVYQNINTAYYVTTVSREEDAGRNLLEGLSEDNAVRQEFIAKYNHLQSIQVLFATYGSSLKYGDVVFELYDKKDQILYTEVVKVADLQDNSYYTFKPDVDVKRGRQYYYTITVYHCEGIQSPAIWSGIPVEKTGTLYMGDMATEFEIDAQYIYENIDVLFLAICILSIAVIIFMVLSRLKIPQKVGEEAGPVLLFVMPFITFCLVEGLIQTPFQMNFAAICWNYVLYVSIYFVIFAVTNRFGLTIAIANTLLFLCGLANYYVSIFRGSPILPWDIFSVQTAAGVVSEYNFQSNIRMEGIILLVILIDLLAWQIKGKCKTIKMRLISGIACISYSVLIIFCITKTTLLNNLDIQVDLWTQRTGYIRNGCILSFAMNTRYLMVEKPEGYSVQAVRDIIKDYAHDEEINEVAEELPNIILVMNESFSDLSVVGNFETNQDYMPFINNLYENTVKGNLYVSIFGAATANSEYETLTGNTMAFLAPGSIAYQQYIRKGEWVPSLSTSLQELGYSCTFMHPMNAANWNRNVVYEAMHFERFIDIGQFENPILIRNGYVSDQDTYEKIIQLYNEKEEGTPMFVLDVTMQNHGGYESGYGFENPVTLVGMNEEFPKTEEYLSLIKISDNAFAYMVNYFKDVDEKTMIIMFGDHQPAVEDAFYERLYGKSLDNLTLEELQRRYMVPLIIWANYPIEEGNIEAMSANYLSSLILEKAGLKLPGYFAYQKELRKTLPVINVNGYMDSDGIHYGYREDSPYVELIHQYKMLQYNSAIDRKNRLYEMYTYQAAE